MADVLHSAGQTTNSLLLETSMFLSIPIFSRKRGMVLNPLSGTLKCQ